MNYFTDASDAEMRHQIAQSCLVIRSHARAINGYAAMIVRVVDNPPCLDELIEAENTLEAALRIVQKAKAIVAIEA